MTTLYFAGTEDISFASLVNFASTGTANYVRSAWSRTSLASNNFNSNAYPMSQYIATGNLGSLTSFWIHGQTGQNNNNGTTNNVTMLAVLDSGGVGRILINGTGTAGQVKICSRNAAGTVTTLVTSAAGAVPSTSTSGPCAFDLFLNYAASGQATLYINGVNVADTGAGVNITTDSATALANVQFSSMNNTTCGWSECIVQDTTTLGLGLLTLPPLAAGNTQSWLPSTLADINPTTINDANFIAATANNSVCQWTVATTAPAGTWSVEAVIQTARVSVGATGPQHFEWNVRTTDGTDHVTGSVAPATSFGNFSNIWATNPHTSSAWLVGDLINAGIESLA
jgi:hypothetical protein